MTHNKSNLKQKETGRSSSEGKTYLIIVGTSDRKRQYGRVGCPRRLGRSPRLVNTDPSVKGKEGTWWPYGHGTCRSLSVDKVNVWKTERKSRLLRPTIYVLFIIFTVFPWPLTQGGRYVPTSSPASPSSLGPGTRPFSQSMFHNDTDGLRPKNNTHTCPNCGQRTETKVLNETNREHLRWERDIILKLRGN